MWVVERERAIYIRFAANVAAFEFLVVQLVHGHFQVSSRLKFNEARAILASGHKFHVSTHPLPSRSRPTSE